MAAQPDGRYTDFTAVTRDALEYACNVLHLKLDAENSAQLMSAYTKLALYPDARNALAALSGFKLAILSNGSPAMLGPLVKNAGLTDILTTVISVDEVKIFKPDPRVYQLTSNKLGVDKTEIGFVSSNYWDAAGAGNFGFHVFWINRSCAEPDRLDAAPRQVLQKLTELTALVEN